MRGFIFGALVLIGLEVVLRSPTSRVAVLLETPTSWLEKWVDPRTALITKPVPAAAPAATSNPAGANTNQLGESTTGSCPPGFPAGIKCLGM